MTRSSKVLKSVKVSNNFNGIEYLLSMDHSNEYNNCISYGPIRYYRRRKIAPTLLTGRRSRFESLNEEENNQREFRREKNRLLSKKLKEKRENIEKELLEELKQLEEEEMNLENEIKYLKFCKNELNVQLICSKEDPLIPLINNENISLFFQEYDHSYLDQFIISQINNIY